MSLIKYPYTNLHEINLDWLIEEVKKCYSPENPPDMAVLSVNGMTGEVTLYTDPAAVLPEIEGTTWSLGRTAAGTLVGIKFNKTLPLQRMNGASLFNIYDEGNPPPYPVTSVNGDTGDITIQVAFNSLSGETISFITPSPDHSWSLDRETVDGAISLKLDTTNDTPSAYLEYVSSDETITRTIKLLTPVDIPSSSGVVSVNGKAGVVNLTGDDIPKEDNSAVSVASAINGLENDTENLNNKIGNTAMGTQATTITGAIKEHNTAITNINTKLGNVGATPVQDQIDTLNSKIANPSSVSYSAINANNQADFEAGLTNALNGMGVPDVRVCPCYANYSGSVTNGGQGIAFFSKISTSVWYVFIVTTSSVKAGYYTGGTWTWL